MYIKRHIEKVIQKVEKMFSAILITGPRQVGKTTMLRTIKPDIPYITLDDPILLQFALEETGTFFKNTPPPLLIDEIQYAPELFPYIKMIVDKEKRKGQFFMTGSQQFKMMKNVSESLAGRIGIVNMLGLSMREIHEEEFYLPFLPIEDYYIKRRETLNETNYKEVWKIIHHGSMPDLYASEIDWQIFYSSYTKTYIERDVRELTQIGDEVKFLKFMIAVAANTGNLLNYASIAKNIGVSQPTVERWISILCTSGIIYLLEPYHNNILKRAIKTPKVYFLDTGLAAYLTKWNTPEVLENGAMAGAFFETYVIGEIIKSYYNAGIEPMLFFYRDKEQNEIDLLIMQDGALFPIEIKKNADPKKSDIDAFEKLNHIPGVKRASGGIICLYDNLIGLKGEDMIIPLKFI